MIHQMKLILAGRIQHSAFVVPIRDPGERKGILVLECSVTTDMSCPTCSHEAKSARRDKGQIEWSSIVKYKGDLR